VRLVPVTESGARVAVVDVGEREGPASVYLGGLGAASTVAFAEVVGHPAVAGRGRHLLVDLVGSGWSDADDGFSYGIDAHAAAVATVLDAVRPGAVRLVGHSLGGSVAISLAAQRPDLVGELVVAEPNLDPGVGTMSARIAAMDEDAFVADGFRRLVEAEDAADSVATLRRWSPRGLHRTAVSLLAERPATFRQQLTALRMPKRYLTGELTGEDLVALRATGCDVRVVPGAGHGLMGDNLDGFVDRLTAGRVALRPVGAGDLDALFGMMRDPEAVRMAAFTAADPDDRAAFDAHRARIAAAPDVVERAVTVDGRFAGIVASFVVEGDTEVTYWIDRAHWGRGVAGRALGLLLELVPARPVHARVASDNAGSLRVLAKAGFVPVGTDSGYANGRRAVIEETVLRLG
jgi:pimeloyl-ACP methyl ester carboxylesterase/L-amino acid N-acyltransferase YncA